MRTIIGSELIFQKMPLPIIQMSKALKVTHVNQIGLETGNKV